jgi:hypothetical protein
MGLRLLPRLIALTQWNAGLFEALAEALELEQSRQLAEQSTTDESRVGARREVVPASVESESQLPTTNGNRYLADYASSRSGYQWQSKDSVGIIFPCSPVCVETY